MENLTVIAKKKLEEFGGFIKANNYNVLKVENNYCEMEALITETSINHLKIAHGGFIFGVADTAAGIAAMTDGQNVVTIDSNINYFKPAIGTKITAIAKLLKSGKTISVYEVIMNNEENELLAKATITYFKLQWWIISNYYG